MGSIREIMAQKNKAQGQQEKKEFKVKLIHYTKLHPSEKNFYRMEEIEELADLLLLAGEIKQNLLVRRTDPGEYEVIAGHKRLAAAKINVERGNKQFEFIPCKEESADDLFAEFELITTNSSQRERTDYEKMKEVERLREIIPQLIGDENLKGRALRKLIAEETKQSETNVARLNNISNNLIPEAKVKFQAGDIGISAANEMAGMPEEKQMELIEENKTSHKEIKEAKETVSNSDTEEFEPEPEKITSSCYSCLHFSECNEKTNTVSYCNEYISKEEAEKTEEQKYSEQQDAIDRETKKKLREQQDTEKMKQLPNDAENIIEEHEIKIASMYFDDVAEGWKCFELRKNDRNYKIEDELKMMEYKDGEYTGRYIKAIITYLLEDYTGLVDGYCILGIQVEGVYRE